MKFFNHLLWKFDMFVYSLFYWRWNRKLIERKDIRQLFIDWLNIWNILEAEPTMGIDLTCYKPLRKRILECNNLNTIMHGKIIKKEKRSTKDGAKS